MSTLYANPLNRLPACIPLRWNREKDRKKRRRRATNTFEAEVRDTPITGTQRGGHVTETGSFIPWKLLIFIGPPGRWHVRRSLTNGARAPLPHAKNKGRREKRKIRDTFSRKPLVPDGVVFTCQQRYDGRFYEGR